MKTKIKEEGRAAARVQRVKSKLTVSVQPATKSEKKATSEADWLAQEDAELQPMRPGPDTINDALGLSMYVGNYGADTWKDPRGVLFHVTRFYPGMAPALAVAFDMPFAANAQDVPRARAERAMKEAFFAKLPVIYLAVDPNESLLPADLRKRLVELMVEKRKAVKAA